jgi:hypothetical protein
MRGQQGWHLMCVGMIPCGQNIEPTSKRRTCLGSCNWPVTDLGQTLGPHSLHQRDKLTVHAWPRGLGSLSSLTCTHSRVTLRDEDIKSVRLPPQSLNLNAHLERFFGSLKSE